MEAHVRIDEGVKRGPRKRASVARRRDPETDRVEGIPAHLNAEQVLELYLSEKTTSHIAEQLGVKRKTLVAWLRQQAPERWKQVQVVRALIRKEDADDTLDSGSIDALILARTRERLRSAQWDLERLDSPTFGPKQEVTVDVRVTIDSTVLEQANTLIGQYKEVSMLSSPTDTDEGVALLSDPTPDPGV